MKRVISVVIVVAGCAFVVSNASATLNIAVVVDQEPIVTVGTCGGEFEFSLVAWIGEPLGEGLAGFATDVSLDAGRIVAVSPPSGPMIGFDRPSGVTGPFGFRGHVVDGALKDVGGAQNTLLNGRRQCSTNADCVSLGVACNGEFCEPTAPFPIGEVVLGIGHTPVVLVTGMVTAPSEPGIYTLTVSNVRATVIRAGEDGSNGFYATEPAIIGTITPLTIEVVPIEGVAAASNSGPLCAGDELSLFAEPDGAVAYKWTGPNGFSSNNQNPIVATAAEGIYTVTVTDITGCSSQASTKVELLTAACEPYTDCNLNSRSDICDVLFDSSEDCNRNLAPDECETLALLVDSTPPDGAIDARVPPSPSGFDTTGWRTLELEFDQTIVLPAADEFEVAVTSGQPPQIINVQATPNGVVVEFDQPIPAGARIRITHVPTCNSVCVGVLPADVNGDGISEAADIWDLMDHLAGDRIPALDGWQCDLDHSGQCTPADILRQIDLLNGAGMNEAWLDVQLPELCP